jgi:ubiquinone/menaquinone biosynthesis C-methylase UbiE
LPERASPRPPVATFDAAYLVTALAEIPDPAAALGELRRVLMPAGRLVVGEFGLPAASSTASRFA